MLQHCGYRACKEQKGNIVLKTGPVDQKFVNSALKNWVRFYILSSEEFLKSSYIVNLLEFSFNKELPFCKVEKTHI